MLIINKVSNNRDVSFKISHKENSNDKTWINSTYQKVSIGSDYPYYFRIHGGFFSGNQYVATFASFKKLTMKTTGVHIGVTGISGSWWVSENEYWKYIRNEY